MVAIVDSKLLAYNELHAKKPIVNLFNTLIPMIRRIESLTRKQIKNIIFTYDIGKSHYRLDLWEHYKGKRNYGTVPENFKLHYEEGVLNIANSLGMSNFPILGVEADDIAGILCNKITDDIVLITNDHDWGQLVLRHNHVKHFYIKNWELIDSNTIKDFTGCETELQFLVKKTILGDSGDNIIGLPGIGPAKFTAWKEEAFKHPDDKLKDLFLELCASIKSKQKTHRDYVYNGVTSCEELYDFNMKLGKVMTGVKFLSDDQKSTLTKCWINHINGNKFDKDKAIALSIKYADGHTGPFGDLWSLDDDLEFYGN